MIPAVVVDLAQPIVDPDVTGTDVVADGLRRGGRGKAEPQGEREGVESAVRGHGRCSFVWHGASLSIGDELRVFRAYSCSGSVVGGCRARVLTAVRALGSIPAMTCFHPAYRNALTINNRVSNHLLTHLRAVHQADTYHPA